jgi:ubiquinol-cytochrome c reductase cytochrome c subunit
MAPNPLTAVAIAGYIRDPSGEMPPYTSKVVSDADVRDIVAYLATIPDPPAVSAIPALH